MFRTVLLSLIAVAATGTAVARDNDRWGRDNDRQQHSERDRRDYRQDNRRDDRRHDYRRDDRRDYGNNRGYDRRYYNRPAPQYFRPAPRPRGWHPGWREPYARGYRYWNNDRYYYVEPGRPALELSFAFPL
jgi:hypothetical protein